MRNTRPISKTRSNPPTTSRLRCSSSAMRSERSRSSALWCVTNGRAAAPPAIVCSTGVSTSTKPRAVEERADRGDRGEADLEDPAGVVVGDEVDVALAEAGVDVGEAVPLVGQRPQRLGEQRELAHLDRELALLGLHHRALDADPVAEVEVVEARRARRRRRPPRETNSWTRRCRRAAWRTSSFPWRRMQHEPARDPHDGVGLGAGLERRRSSSRSSAERCGRGRSAPGTGRRPRRAARRPCATPRARVVADPLLDRRRSLVPLEDDAQAVEGEPRLVVLDRARVRA